MTTTTAITTTANTLPSAINQNRKKLEKLIAELNALFLERTDLIKVMLAGYLSSSNLFIGGAPGTGKTMLSKAIAAAFQTDTFYYLMSATTQPDEILGAIDLGALQNGDFRRDLDGKLADCHLAILDEGFKANSPCLNTLLGIILDHEIENGKKTVKVPLISLIVCSNELPQEEVLAPFWDRLSLRYWVKDVGRNGASALMQREAGLIKTPKITVNFSLSDLQQFQAEVAAMPVARDVIDNILQVTDRLGEVGINPSTRKFVQIIDLIKAWAFIQGASSVTEEHLTVLEHILWDKPEQGKEIKKAVSEVVNAAMNGLNQILQDAEAIVSKVALQPKEDKARYRSFLGGADFKLLEMIKAIEKIETASHRGSRKQVAASNIKAKIEKLRIDKILKPQAEMDLAN